ncbi:unnamed protein product [Calypogeia fissa]
MQIVYNDRLESIEPSLVIVESKLPTATLRNWRVTQQSQGSRTDFGVFLCICRQEGRLLFETQFWVSGELHLFGFLFSTNSTQHLRFGRILSSLLRRMWLEGTMKAAT